LRYHVSCLLARLLARWAQCSTVASGRPIKQQLTLRLDAEVIAWFKTRAADGEKYQTAINRVLRDYVEAHGRWA